MPRPPSQSPHFSSVADVSKRLSSAGYLPDAQIATTVFLADRLGKPLLVEGPAGRKPSRSQLLRSATDFTFGAELTVSSPTLPKRPPPKACISGAW